MNPPTAITYTRNASPPAAEAPTAHVRYFVTAPGATLNRRRGGNPAPAGGPFHAKRMGTTRSACGQVTTSWKKLWEVPFIGEPPRGARLSQVGLFLAVTAVRDATPAETAAAVSSWFNDRFIACTPSVTVDDGRSSERIEIYEPRNGWTVIRWPQFFRFIDNAAAHVSDRLAAVVSSVDIYHSECWTHLVHTRGVLVDQYCTNPILQMTTDDDRREIARRYRGNPEIVSHHLGSSPRTIKRYYRRNRRSWGYDDWDFAKLWQEFGISYPEPGHPQVDALALPDRWAEALDVRGNAGR